MLENFNEKLAAFVAGAQKLVDAQYNDPAKGMVFDRKLEIDPRGQRFIRIAVAERGQNRSVWCFVDTTNGDVLKPAGWKKPAKHARGNIFDEWNGLKQCTGYGPAYLR